MTAFASSVNISTPKALASAGSSYVVNSHETGVHRTLADKPSAKSMTKAFVCRLLRVRVGCQEPPPRRSAFAGIRGR